jgi:hypothetical protein
MPKRLGGMQQQIGLVGLLLRKLPPVSADRHNTPSKPPGNQQDDG